MNLVVSCFIYIFIYSFIKYPLPPPPPKEKKTNLFFQRWMQNQLKLPENLSALVWKTSLSQNKIVEYAWVACVQTRVKTRVVSVGRLTLHNLPIFIFFYHCTILAKIFRSKVLSGHSRTHFILTFMNPLSNKHY